MLGIRKLFSTDNTVMLRPQLTAGVTAGIYKQFAFFLVAYFFKSLEIIVQVIVDNDYVVILIEFIVKLIRLSDTFAGRACELIIRVICTDIVLKDRRRNYNLVKAIISEVHDEVAEIVGEVFFLNKRICKRKSQWDTAVVECLDNSFDEGLVAVAVLKTSSVPYCRWKRTIYGSYLHSLTEVLGTILQHFRKNDIEAVVFAEIRQVKTCFHNRSLSVSESTAVFESFQQSETRLVAAFRLSHVVHICFKDIECTRGASLDFELFKSHRHVLFPYIIGRDVSSQVTYFKDTALRIRTVTEVLRVEFIGIERHTRVFFDMLVVRYLLFAYTAIVSASARTSGFTAGIYEKLTVLFARKLLKHLEVVIKVIVNDNDAVVLTEFFIELIGVGNTLAGRACKLVIRVILADIVL